MPNKFIRWLKKRGLAALNHCSGLPSAILFTAVKYLSQNTKTKKAGLSEGTRTFDNRRPVLYNLFG